LHRTLLFLSLLSWACRLPALPAALPADAAASQAAANAAWSAGQAAAALPLYQQAHLSDPSWAAPLYGLALCQLQLGQDQAALASLDRALGLAPGSDAIRRLRQEALARLRQAAALPVVGAADLDRRLGRWDAAERGYQLALQVDPDCSQAYAGLAALRAQRGDGATAWMDPGQALRLDPASPEAVGLRSLTSVDRGNAGRGAEEAEPGMQAGGRWTGFVRVGGQVSHSQSGPTDRDSLDGVFFGHVGWEGAAWPLDLGYTLMDVSSDVGGAASSVEYQALSAAWWQRGRGRPGAVLMVDEAVESSQGQWVYWHHLLDLRWQGQAVGDWRPWAGAQVLWERYASTADLDSVAPSVGMGVNGPLPWAGQAQAEARWRFDATQAEDDQDQGASLHLAAQWRSGRNGSPRVDLDAKVQSFPRWPEGPGSPRRQDRLLDSRWELVLWQGRQASASAVVEGWRDASTDGAYAGQGSTEWLGGTWAW
jgi:tetratricopeptide (TPR) repeat protein